MSAAGSTKLVTLLCAILTAAVIIMCSIATAGMTKSSAPLVNLPVGDADVRKLDVNKIVPQASNVLHFLGAAMLSDKVTDDEVFQPLKEVSQTSHLKPLLMLLVNGRSYPTTIKALNTLSPIALDTDEESLGSIKGLYQIISLSNDPNKTINGLKTILAANSGNASRNSSQAAASASPASTALQALLMNSRNPAATVSDLVKLGSLGNEQTAKLVPYMSILPQSTNVSLTLESFNEILTANISSGTTNQLISQIMSSPNPANTLGSIVNSAAEPEATVLRALASLLGTFPNPNVILGVLSQSNSTEARDTLRAGLPIFIDLSNNSRNTTTMLINVQRLALSSTATSRESLRGLNEVLDASEDQNATLAAISNLTSSPVSPNTAAAVPPLFSLLEDSNNITNSFDSLLDITGFAIEEPEKFSPIVRIVDAAADDEEEQFMVNQHIDVVERMFEKFDIPTDYRMGIFNLCALRADGSVKQCTKQRAVQDFDFRNIVYDHLRDSDIYPYLVALDIGPEELYLEGRMLRKQHMYVPAMRALLAFDLIALIFAFFLIITLLVTFYNPSAFSHLGLVNKVLAILVAAASFLSAMIAVIVTAVIKNGTGYDNYGVVYKGGAGFTALQWVSVCLAVITVILVWITIRQAKHKNGDPEEGHLSNSEEEFTKEPKTQVQSI